MLDAPGSDPPEQRSYSVHSNRCRYRCDDHVYSNCASLERKDISSAETCTGRDSMSLGIYDYHRNRPDLSRQVTKWSSGHLLGIPVASDRSVCIRHGCICLRISGAVRDQASEQIE